MRRRAWAWWLAFDALIFTVAPMVGMFGLLGVKPMTVAAADALWIAALVLTVISFLLWRNQDSHPPPSHDMTP